MSDMPVPLSGLMASSRRNPVAIVKETVIGK